MRNEPRDMAVDMGKGARNSVRSQNIRREMPFVDRRGSGQPYAFLGEREREREREASLPVAQLLWWEQQSFILSLSVCGYHELYSRISPTHKDTQPDTYTHTHTHRLLSLTTVHMSSHSPTTHTSRWSRPPTIVSYHDSIGQALRCGLSFSASVLPPEKPWRLSQTSPTHWPPHCLQPYCFDSDNFINELIGGDQVPLKGGSVDAWLPFTDLDFAQL